MDVEPCYPLFSAALESAEALANSQQKFQTLNLKTPKVTEETFLRTMKRVWIWKTTGRKELMKTVAAHYSLLWVLGMEVENIGT